VRPLIAATAIAEARTLELAGGSCADQADVHMALAEKFIASEDFEEAINEMEQAWKHAQQVIAGDGDCDEASESVPEGETISEDVDGDVLINAAQTVIIESGVEISGVVKVEGGTLIADDVEFKDGIEASGGASITIQNSSVEKDVKASGPGGSLVLVNTTVKKSVSANELDILTITGSTIEENVTAEKNVDVTITGNTIEKDLSIKDTSGTCVDSPNDEVGEYKDSC